MIEMGEEAISEGFSFEKLADGWQVTGYCGDQGEVAIPSLVEGEPVTMVKSKAFEDNYVLTSVTIPDTVTFIGTYAFWGCKNLESAVLPESLSSIGLGTFMQCTSLVDVVMPKYLTTIGDGAFRSCTSLVALSIPPSVEIIGDSAFRNCTSLASAEMPSSVTRIDRSAYRFCDSLSNVVMTTSVEYIGPRAFQDCPSLESVTVLGDDMDATLTAFGNHSLYYLVADYVIPRNLISFDEGKRLFIASKNPGSKLLGARVIAAFPDLAGTIPSKLTLMRALAEAGKTDDLHALQKVKGYFSRQNLLRCIDVASAKGRTETVAYLMQQLSLMDTQDSVVTGSASCSSLDDRYSSNLEL